MNTGREWDQETSLYYCRARYYDPVTGRFLSEDPIEFQAGSNFYAYTLNNPVRFGDPSGKNPAVLTWPWIGEGVVGVICFGSGACETAVVVGRNRGQTGRFLPFFAEIHIENFRQHSATFFSAPPL